MKRLVATAALLAAVATGCSDNNRPEAATITTTTRRPPTCDGFRAGDRITVEDLLGHEDLQGRSCVRTFDCADGRIHVEANQGGEWRLEGFAPIDQRGNPRADANDAMWQQRGPEYDGTGGTKLQFDCGG